jgi:predicted alpha/beta-fold hydrolase
MSQPTASQGLGAAVLNGSFRPLPFLGNTHVQTVLGHWWRGATPRLAGRERQVALGDGDRLVLHDNVPDGWRPGGLTAVLIHGLGGSHQSGPLLRVAGLLLPYGIRVVRLDLRGAGRGAGLARRIYHGGCSEDLRAALAEVHRWDPAARVALVGFSLGANVALKLAGEAAAQPVPGLERVAAVAPPIDLERCAGLIAQRHNRLYEVHFLHHLLRQVRRLERHFPDVARARFPRRLTLRTFDELYTAPRGGFTSALDYYRRSSSLPLLEGITVPTLVLTARDDPFIAVAPFQALSPPTHVQVHILSRGGHLGFLGWDGLGGVRWAERQVAQFVIAGADPATLDRRGGAG